MNANAAADEIRGLHTEEAADSVEFDFAIDRRRFVQVLGTGLMIAIGPGVALAQNRGGRGGGRGGGGNRAVAARLHIGNDGLITVLTGKIEMGQGARTELTQAAAEELRVPVSQIQMIMGDTGLVPDDGLTAGSRTTPSTVPAVRQGAAAARNLLLDLAAKKWNVERNALEVRDGVITEAAGQRTLTYADLARSGEAAKAFKQNVPDSVTLTPVEKWHVMGTSVPRANRRDLVTGAHKYPSDYTRPGMLYGKVLRPPSYGAKLTSVDLAPAQAMKDVVAAQDGSFVGVAAPTTWHAEQALRTMAATAKWEPASHPSSRDVFDYLRKGVQGGVPTNPFAEEIAQAAKSLKATYHVAYVQHAPMETRAALAEWTDGKLTVWTGTQNPFGYHGELARAFRLSNENVRVIVPDFGGGFGGKHTGEAAIEAARLAQAAGKPVLLRWTREEEFTWAYFRPAAVIDIEASLDDQGTLTSWHFININSGGAAIDTPYRAGKARSRFVGSNAPLRQGSYRALAATANNFARECFMDELARGAGGSARLPPGPPGKPAPAGRAGGSGQALQLARAREAKTAGPGRRPGLRHRERLLRGRLRGNRRRPGCQQDRRAARLRGLRVRGRPEPRQPHRPGARLHHHGAGAGVARGDALRGRQDAERDLQPLPGAAVLPTCRNSTSTCSNRPDLASAGGGETPIIAIAPAIANAVFHATGRRIREMPIRLQAAQEI